MTRFRFGRHEVDVDRFVLLRDGEVVPVEPRPLGLLIHLLERHPAAVSKDELLDELWSDAAVTEGSLTRAVRAARRALGESAEPEGVIRTVRGRGYGIGGVVERFAEAAPSDPGEPAARESPSGFSLERDPSASTTRRLAAVLSADVAGYSRLLAEDEAATVTALQAAFARMTATVEQAGGRLVDATGDNLLAEFPSAVAAVEAALELQGQAASTEPAPEPEEPALVRFRVGLHLGEVLADGPRIYGDAVNIAARLESLAPVGGLAASAAVVDSVRGRLRIDWIDAGETQLKNIAQPVRFYGFPTLASGETPEPIPFVALPENPRSARGMRGIGDLAPLDRVLLVLVVPLWMLCFGLFVHSLYLGTGLPPIGVPVLPVADQYPLLEVLPPAVSFDETDLQPGDRILRLEDVDLQGKGSVGVWVTGVKVAGDQPDIEVAFQRGDAAGTTRLPVVPLRTYAPIILPLAPSLMALGLLLLWRKPRDPITAALFHACLAWAIALSGIFGGPVWKTTLSIVLVAVFNPLAAAATLRFLYLFPQGSVEWTPLRKSSLVAVGLLGLVVPTFQLGFPFSMATGLRVFPPVYALTLLAVLWMLRRKFAKADALERRRMRWLVYGAYAAALPQVFTFGSLALVAGDMQVAVMSQVAMVLIPITIFIGVARYDLFDVDRLISTTVSYNLLLVAAAAALLLGAPYISGATAQLLGVPGGVGTLSAAVVLALLVPRANGRLRPRLEQTLFPARYAFDQGAAELLRELGAATEPRAVVEAAARGVAGLARGEGSALYARSREEFVPLFGAREDTPGLPADGALVATLRHAEAPMVLRSTARPGRGLDPFARATLEDLGAEVVIPVSRRGVLDLILCVGPKNSGDVYTSTDVALLSSIGQALSVALERSDARR